MVTIPELQTPKPAFITNIVLNPVTLCNYRIYISF